MGKNVSFRICMVILILLLLNTAFATPRFLTISDIHYGAHIMAKDGEDTGEDFLTIALNKFTQLTQRVDFIIHLGDLPAHSLLNTAVKADYEKVVFHQLYVADKASKPMFYVAGNNDSLSGNYQPFESQNGFSPLKFATDWSGACAHCKGLIIDDSHMRTDGYYSSYVIPGNKEIVLIALNTIQWADPPFLLLKNYPHQQRDALAQLSWLDQQLKTHRSKQLLIAMHIPPGKSYKGQMLWKEEYLKKFIALLEEHYHSYGQITLLSSHTHMDEFRSIHLNNGANIYSYSTPSISRNHHNYPGMKLFLLNNHMAIKNFITYYTDSTTTWGDKMYPAMDSADAIFPHCHFVNLSQCLNNYSKNQICNAVEQGSFYGVKSPYVHDKGACKLIFEINAAPGA